MMQIYCALYLCLLLAVPLAYTLEQLDDNRQEKLISTFQIVRFPNDACIGTNARNGTCYTSAECSDKGGTSAGSCADGFGVCCSFLITTCDQTTSENITYWTQPATVPVGTCGLTVCPVGDDICQLRLDFTNFVITGPSTLTYSQTRRHYGEVYGDFNDANVLAGSNWATNCFLDSFSAQGASPSTSPPMICGINTGYHMYVEADEDRCNRLTFYLANTMDAIPVGSGVNPHNRGQAAVAATRTWDLTVTQLECTSTVLPPPGCTQYFFGAGTYTINSYNFQGTTSALNTFTGTHLANQHQRICVRRERGNCVGCFSATNLLDFNISGNPSIALHHTITAGCCGYATMNTGIANAKIFQTSLTIGDATAALTNFGWDCIIIPGAYGATATVIPLATQTTANTQQTLFATTAPTPWGPQICGSQSGIGMGSATLTTASDFTIAGVTAVGNNRSVCTRQTPFILEFMSDDIEGQGGTALNTEYSAGTTVNIMQGFTLKSTQLGCVAT